MSSAFSQNHPPRVSVLIISWNSSAHLPRCLDCLKKQTFRDFEVIVVDNGSTDHPTSILSQDLKGIDLQLEQLPMNQGYAVANNIGARLARGIWLALLNADAFPEPDWLEHLLHTAEKNPEHQSFTSRQLQANAPELLDGAGDAYHITGLAWRRDYNQSSKDHGLEEREAFSACPTAALYSREDFLDLGGFDEDYFSYFEDVDLGFRLRLAGKRCLYVPEAVVQHIGSASTGKRSDFSVYYGYRNMIWTFVKNMPTPLLWFFLPLHLGTLLFFVVYLTWRGQGKIILGAIRDAIRGFPKMIGKRKAIQKNRKVGSRELLQVMSTGLFEPYREFMQRNKRLT